MASCVRNIRTKKNIKIAHSFKLQLIMSGMFLGHSVYAKNAQHNIRKQREVL